MTDPHRPDPRERPRDPAGTFPKHEPDDLLPASEQRLLRDLPGEGRAVPGVAPGASLFDDGAERLPVDHDVPASPEAVQAAVAEREAHRSDASPRFQFLLGALLAVGAAALLALGAYVVRGSDDEGLVVDAGPTWSTWAPTAAGGDGATQIAEHVGRQYRLDDGTQLVKVDGGPMEVAGLPLTPVLREPASQGGDIVAIEGKGVLYRLCGLGEGCAIAKGTPSKRRHLLLRREALELALYSFHYLDVENVAVFLPPRKGQDPTQALFFRRADVRDEVAQPLSATLSSRTPRVANVLRSPDAATVNALTTSTLFQFSLTQGNQDTRAFLVLDPLLP